ncbi:MAG: cell division protein FtsQ/DivIB [Anaerolineales bacterium]
MARKQRERRYYRTAALLGAQPPSAVRRRVRSQRVEIPWRALVPVLLLAALGLWGWLDPHWYVEASRLQIAGSESVETAREVALAAEVLGLHGVWLRPRLIASHVISTVPAVTVVEAQCWPYPAQCIVSIEERVPVLVWMTGEGLYWVDAEGVVFPAREERPSLPMVRGPLPEEGGVSPEILEGITALADLGVPSQELTYHAERGLVWDDARGCLVAFGVGGERMVDRWRIYAALAADLEARGMAPRQIDVRFPSAPTFAVERTW